MADTQNLANEIESILRELQQLCSERRFAHNDILRNEGEHYRDMYFITEGEVKVETTNPSTQLITRGIGSSIGEIGFLRGTPANATVTAMTPTRVLYLDDIIFRQLKQQQPETATRLFRYLAHTAEDRTSYDLTYAALLNSEKQADDNITVLLCRDEKALRLVQKLRFDIYCGELGRDSPNADHERGTLSDEFDKFAYNFIAFKDKEPIGALRMNFAAEGSLGILEGLYGMDSSSYHPQDSGICTKFVVKRSQRGGPAAMKLVSDATRYGLRCNKKVCFIDTIPSLQHYYRAMGFKVASEVFFHSENGPSVPMKVDLQQHGKQLCGDAGVSYMLKLFVKAKAYKWADKLRGR